MRTFFAEEFVTSRIRPIDKRTSIAELIPHFAYLVTLPVLYSKEGRVGINIMQQLGYPLEDIRGWLDVFIAKPDERAHYHPRDRECQSLEHAVATGALEIVSILDGSGKIALQSMLDVVVSVEVHNPLDAYCILVVEGGVKHQITDVRSVFHLQEPQTEEHKGQKVGSPCPSIELDGNVPIIHPRLARDT